MDQMGLIVFAKTGHVLAAFTRAIDPAGALTADNVVGSALFVRDPDSAEEMAHVEPQHLAVKIVDRRDDVLLLHRRYIVEEGLPVQGSAATLSLSYADPVLTVDIGVNPSDDIEAWLQLEDGVSQPIVASVEIPAAGTSGDVELTLTPGTEYRALVLAPGFAAATETFTA